MTECEVTITEAPKGFTINFDGQVITRVKKKGRFFDKKVRRGKDGHYHVKVKESESVRVVYTSKEPPIVSVVYI